VVTMVTLVTIFGDKVIHNFMLTVTTVSLYNEVRSFAGDLTYQWIAGNLFRIARSKRRRTHTSHFSKGCSALFKFI